MKRGIGKIKRISFAVIGAVLLVFLLTPKAVAAGKMGTLTVYYHGVTPEGTHVGLQGADFSLYKVGKQEGKEWKLQGDFENASVSLEDMSASGQRKAAGQLYDFAVKEERKGEIKTTKNNGKAVFYNLEEGMYLCTCMADISCDNGVFRSAPFLVFIPEVDENGKCFYEVTVEPKNEWVGNETKPQEPMRPGEDSKNDDVKTGDDTDILQYMMILLGSIGIIMIIIGWSKKEVDSDSSGTI